MLLRTTYVAPTTSAPLRRGRSVFTVPAAQQNLAGEHKHSTTQRKAQRLQEVTCLPSQDLASLDTLQHNSTPAGNTSVSSAIVCKATSITTLSVDGLSSRLIARLALIQCFVEHLYARDGGLRGLILCKSTWTARRKLRSLKARICDAVP